MKTLIATYAVKRSDFIPLQYDCVKKYWKEDFEYIVFNNAPESDPAHSSIHWTCDRLGIKCIKVGNRVDDGGSRSHAAALNWSYQNVVLSGNYDYMAALDFDMFPVSDFSISNYMNEYAIAGVAQNGRPTYWWPGLLFLKLFELPNKDTIRFDCGQIDGNQVDSGGYLALYHRANPSVKIRQMIHTCQISSKQVFSHFFVDDIVQKYDPDFAFEIYASKFLHYGRGSNWDGRPSSYMDKKNELLVEIITKQVSGNTVFKEVE